MPPVDHIGQRADAPARLVVEPDRSHHLAINVGRLLAAAQVVDRALAPLRCDTESDAATGAAAIEPQHQTRFFRRAAMVERIDAERAVLADQPRRDLFDELEARPPYQRAIAEHPEIAFGRFRYGEGDSRHLVNRQRSDPNIRVPSGQRVLRSRDHRTTGKSLLPVEVWI